VLETQVRAADEKILESIGEIAAFTGIFAEPAAEQPAQRALSSLQKKPSFHYRLYAFLPEKV